MKYFAVFKPNYQ